MQMSSSSVKFFLVVSIFLTFWLVFISQAIGGNLKEIELTDGSVIQAEVLSFSNGIYRLKSDTLGTFSLAEEKVQNISFKNGSSSPIGRQNTSSRRTTSNLSQANGQQIQQQVQEMTNWLMQDPEAMQLIQSLRANPSVQKIMKDQNLMRAINQQDLGRLSTDPKVQALMRNKTIGKILEKTQ